MDKRNLLWLITFFISIISQAQTLDFGLELKANTNTAQLQPLDNGSGSQYTKPGFYDNDPYTIRLPARNFEFVSDDGQLVFGRWDEVTVNQNFEIPLSVRFTTKKNWFFNVKFSSAKFRFDYNGSLFRGGDYYQDQYGTFDDYLVNYGGLYDSSIVNLNDDIVYNDTTAFISWYNYQIEADPYSQSELRHVEEVKFYSGYLGFGYKFLKHKIIHPYFNLGVGFRLFVGNQKRRHFEIIDDLNGTSLTRQDLLPIAGEIELFSGNAFSTRIELGAEFYRYYVGASFENSSLFENDRVNQNIGNFGSTIAGVNTFSFMLGMNLFSHDLHTQSNQKDIYTEEFSSLSSQLDKNRKWSFGVRVEAPVLSFMDNFGRYVIGDFRDNLDPESEELDLSWQILGFEEITKIDWTPKLELGLRYSPHRRLETELELGLSQLQYDTEVIELRALVDIDSLGNYVYSPGEAYVNSHVLRNKFLNASANLNLYYSVVNNGLVDFKLFGGVGFNYIIPPFREVEREFGVNGSGDDLYSSFFDYYWNGTTDIATGYTWFSDYEGPMGLNFEAQEYLESLENAGTGSLEGWERYKQDYYFTLSLGTEVELNRFLLGASYEFTVSEAVDNILIKKYNKFNFSLGYLLFTKNRINERLKSDF